MFKWIKSHFQSPYKGKLARELDQAISIVLWQGNQIQELEHQVNRERNECAETIAIFLLRAGGKVSFSQDFIDAAKLDTRSVKVTMDEQTQDFVYELVAQETEADNGNEEQ